MKVKICGITNLEDARAAESAGADFLGFIFEASSPRSVSVEDAAGIISKLLGTAKTVGVFVESDADFIRRAALECGLFALQLHGGQSDNFARGLSGISQEIWRTVWVGCAADLQSARSLEADVLVADSRSGKTVGGTGKVCDWSLAESLAKSRKIALAGGINCQNAAQAALSVNPWILDANSGVEISPRRKDPAKIENLIKIAKEI